MAIPPVIERVNHQQRGTKRLFLAALHGHSGHRLASRTAVIPEFAAFDAALLRCIKASGSEWLVHELYNITEEQRLDEITSWLRETENEDGYEVRSFCLPDSIPHLAPLIIGARDLFLGLEDPRYYRVQDVIHVYDEGAAELGAKYFESLWNTPGLFVLRSALRVNDAEIDRLRSSIRACRS
jgi:hypothetical protein